MRHRPIPEQTEESVLDLSDNSRDSTSGNVSILHYEAISRKSNPANLAQSKSEFFHLCGDAQLMGILNATPDSCFDQGRWFDPASAVERGIRIWQEGADWLDIGGESTRPGASPVSEEEELRRVIPLIGSLKQEIPIPISIDTMKATVAEKAIEAGAALINDVSGFRDPDMRRVAADSALPICVMHMDRTPLTMQCSPHYPGGIVPFLIEWFQRRIELLLNEGVQESKIILDPGIGFGKTVAHNRAILGGLQKIGALGFPLLVGFSRKSFLGKILGKTYPDLLAASIAANTLALASGVAFIRVHDIPEHRDLIDLMQYFKADQAKAAAP